MASKLKRVLPGLAVLGASILVTVALVLLRPAPERVDPPVLPPTVTTVRPVPLEGPLTVGGFGTVRPLREIPVVAEVSGKVVWMSESLVSGGLFRVGEAMLRIDPSDYENAVTVAQATVMQRRLDLLLAREERALARREWELLEARGGAGAVADTTDLGNLTFKEPQLRVAEALLKSAEARLADAQARLARTQITAPFNGRIRTKNADLGQVVGPGAVLASFYGTDTVEIDVPLSGRQAQLLGTRVGTRAWIEAAGQEWEGTLHRTEGAVRRETRTLDAVVRVYAPYAGRPLRVGTHVAARIEGVDPGPHWSLPRDALRNGGFVWVVEADRLVERNVDIAQEAEETIYVTAGVSEDDRVAVSTLPVMTRGMQVRTAGEE